MALITLAEYKTLLGITSTSADAQINAAITKASAIITKRTGLAFDSASRTEYYSGMGTQELILRSRPVTSVTSVAVDDGGYFSFASGAFDTSTVLTSGTDYALDINSAANSDTGILYRVGDVWGRKQIGIGSDLVGMATNGRGNIKVVYVAGYSTTPEDLKLLGILLTRQIVKTAPEGGMQLASESFEYWSYSLQKTDPADYSTIQSIMKQYTDIVF